MAGILAAHPFFCVLDGDRYLRERPMKRIVEPLRLMGAVVDGRDDGRLPPLSIRGGSLKGVSYQSPVASAQVKSCLLLAGLRADGVTTVTEPARSRDHTEKLLQFLGVTLAIDGTAVSLQGGQAWEGFELSVPGDPSAAAFPIAAALITPNSEVTVTSICINPTRTGFFDILREMGADIAVTGEHLEGGEPVADITARTSRLRGIDVDPSLVPRAIDEFPLLAALAMFAEGRTVFRGAGELRVKESDRISAMAGELGRLGAAVDEYEDGLSVLGGRPLSGGDCRSLGDHRVAMALAVAASAMDRPVTIGDTGCIDTSFPGFWNTMEALGARCEREDG
jgi:3-phosphoshikimate 1-carboxyvinyltransferase